MGKYLYAIRVAELQAVMDGGARGPLELSLITLLSSVAAAGKQPAMVLYHFPQRGDVALTFEVRRAPRWLQWLYRFCPRVPIGDE